MRVILTAPAQAELREATQWYAARSRQVARRSVDAYKHARQLVQDAPERWAELEPGVRSVILRRFPYSVIYVIEDDAVLVLAVSHHKREPGYWR